MFMQAKPIYPTGKSTEMHTFAAFRATTNTLQNVYIYITASSFYQLWVNGSFVSFGPARTAKGYARVDELPLSAYACEGENEIVVLVTGHVCCSLSTVRQPSFLQAELRCGEAVLCATGRDFEAYLPPHRVQKVKRYSVQRHFSEVWDFQHGASFCLPQYRTEIECIANAPQPIVRRAPYAYYENINANGAASVGTFTFDETLPCRTDPYSHVLSERMGKFNETEILYHPFEWLQRQRQQKTAGATDFPIHLSENEYVVLDFKRIETGFLQLCAAAQSDADVVIGFSEDASPDRFEFTNMNAYNTVEVLFGAGEKQDFMSFEPYVGRYFIVAVRKGHILLENFGIKTFMHDPNGVLAEPPKDAVLHSVFQAAIRTFAHNAVDIYMDCPSRERAGWLCDSYFTGKTEYAMFGNTFVEDAFLENYRLFKNEGIYPNGALPMCYPSDEEDEHTFIPQWTMWYILEAEDYVHNRGHLQDAELFRPSIEALLAFYKQYENEDGLLENLPSWNFVEWSAANKWTKNVNYPTNFLYAGVLEAVSRLYDDPVLLQKSCAVREKTIAQSFDGVRFYDHAVRNGEHKLILQADCSEIAQYYAILFGGFNINDAAYAAFKKLVTVTCTECNGEFPADMEPINAFIGVYLRMEALLKIGEYDLVLSDIAAFFGEMEKETGTLWEYRQRKGSRDHGFASYAYVAILRALRRQ